MTNTPEEARKRHRLFSAPAALAVAAILIIGSIVLVVSLLKTPPAAAPQITSSDLISNGADPARVARLTASDYTFLTKLRDLGFPDSGIYNSLATDLAKVISSGNLVCSSFAAGGSYNDALDEVTMQLRLNYREELRRDVVEWSVRLKCPQFLGGSIPRTN